MIDKVKLKEMRQEAHAQLGYCCRTVMELDPVVQYVTALEQMLHQEISTKPDRCEFTQDWVEELNNE